MFLVRSTNWIYKYNTGQSKVLAKSVRDIWYKSVLYTVNYGWRRGYLFRVLVTETTYLIGHWVVSDWLLETVPRIVPQIRLRHLPHTHTSAVYYWLIARRCIIWVAVRKFFANVRLKIADCNFVGPTILSLLVSVQWCLVKEEHVWNRHIWSHFSPMFWNAPPPPRNGARGGAVGWGTALQAGKSGFRFSMVSLKFFSDIILPVALWPCSWLSLYQKWVPGIFPEGQRRPVRRTDNLTTFMCRMSWNLGASTSWNPQGLSWPVQSFIIIKSFYSLWGLGHPWRASRHWDLQLSLWPHSMIFLFLLFHPLLFFATSSSAYLFFYVPEDSNLMLFSLLLLLLCVMCVQCNSIFFFLSVFLFASVGWFSIVYRL